MSQTIDLVVTINSVQKSSKSELSSGTFDHFKVYTVTDYFGTKTVGDTDYFDTKIVSDF